LDPPGGVSCTAAAGETTVPGLRSKSYGALQTRAISRARDNHPLTYWKPETTMATNTFLLLKALDGSGQCGSWAEFLIDMWKAHGDNGRHKVLIAQSIIALRNNQSILFLVKNWYFDPPHPVDPRTFLYEFRAQCFDKPGVPGQNNPDPPPTFKNHFIVNAGGKLYDPAYGSPTFSTTLAWENASIDGLGPHYQWGFCGVDGRDHHAGFYCGYRKSDLSTTQLLEFVDLTTERML